VGRYRKPSRLFLTGKCATAIPVTSDVHRDLLIVLALDPAVSSIEFIAAAKAAGRVVQLDATVVTLDGYRHAIEIEGARPRDIDELALHLLTFDVLGIPCVETSVATIRREPRISSARAIWGHIGLPLPFRDRAEVLAAVEELGLATVDEIGARVSLRGPVLSAICIMACEGALEIGLESPLGGSSVVRPGSLLRPADGCQSPGGTS
jgi:hypothetical protein